MSSPDLSIPKEDVEENVEEEETATEKDEADPVVRGRECFSERKVH